MSDDTPATPATGETPSWFLRAQDELQELRDRISKLHVFISDTVNQQDLETNHLLKEQLSAMILYEVALSKRLANS